MLVHLDYKDFYATKMSHSKQLPNFFCKIRDFLGIAYTKFLRFAPNKNAKFISCADFSLRLQRRLRQNYHPFKVLVRFSVCQGRDSQCRAIQNRQLLSPVF